MNLAQFPRRGYVTTPTPIELCSNFSRALGADIDVYIKRDDMLPGTAGGNKTRKLDFCFADALQKGCDTVITCGAVQSNHCRLTLAAAGPAARETDPSPALPTPLPVSGELLGVARSLAQDGSTAVTWACVPGETYELLWATNLMTGFTAIASDLVSSEDHMTFVHPLGDVPAGFYAIRIRR